MAEEQQKGNEQPAEPGLDQFVLDEPWSPVSYFNEENEEIKEHKDELEPLAEKNLSNLFQLNAHSIQSDLKKIRSFSVECDDVPIVVQPVYGQNECDDDNIQKYITYEDTEEHLKVLDSTATINKKSIEGDLERLRRFKIASLDLEIEDISVTDKPSESKSQVQSFTGKPKGSTALDETTDVGEILTLLPDIEGVLDDVDVSISPETKSDTATEKSNGLTLDEREVDIDLLEFPKVPSDFPNNREKEEQFVCDDSTKEEKRDVIVTELVNDIGGPLEHDKEAINADDNSALSVLKNISTNDVYGCGEVSVPSGDANVIDISEVKQPMTEESEVSLSDIKNGLPLESQDPHPGVINVSNNKEVDGLISKATVFEEDQGVTTSTHDDHDITSALIADIILAEETAVNGDGTSEMCVHNDQLHAGNVEPESTITGHGDQEMPTINGNRVSVNLGGDNEEVIEREDQSISGNIENINEQEARKNLDACEGNRARDNTVASSGSEDLEEFIRSEYQENVLSEATVEEQNSGTMASPATGTQNLDPRIRTLGTVPPKWVPDKDAKNCMACNARFTVVKRRHHCRACGKVLCAACCNLKSHLQYMNYKLARVCQVCCNALIMAQNALPPPDVQSPSAAQTATRVQDSNSSDLSSLTPSPNQSQLPPASESPPSYQQSTTFQAPVVGSNTPPQPSGNVVQNFYPVGRSGNSRLRTESEVSAVIMFNSAQTNLPPVMREKDGVIKIVNSPDLSSLFEQIHDKDKPPVVFLVNKNLIVRVKIVHTDCCVGKICWCFCSDGMGASNQEEIVVLNEYHGDDVLAIKCVLQQFNSIFEKAKQGCSVGDLGCVTFDSHMLLNPNLTGMIFFKSTLQCTQNIIKPTSPFLFGHYLHASEIPWGKVFPMRIFLRLGYEYKSYPCPIFNDLYREALFSAGGRTIINLLADLRNYQYSIQKITGVQVLLKNKDTVLKLPQNRYDEVLKVVSTSEENVLCFGGNFTNKTDSFLVCVEKDGGFTTQTVHVSKRSRKATLASFIVFSAALKPTQDGIVAKTNIVEDGVMVQVTADFMKTIRSAIKDMRDHTVKCGSSTADEGRLIIEWSSGEPSERSRHSSSIDDMSLDNLTNMKIRHSYDYSSSTNPFKIHWMEVYFLPNDGNTVDRLSARELGQMTSSVAKACMEALRPHLATLCELKMNWIGLRVSLESDMVEYKIGSNKEPLPDELTKDLDDKLIPAIHGVMSNLPQGKIQVELIFQVVRIV